MKKTALITGATSGLGLSYARYFAARDFDLILVGRRPLLHQRCAQLRGEYGVKAIPLFLDLGKEGGVDALLAAVEGQQIDVLVNNAGFGLSRPLMEAEEEQIRKLCYLHMDALTRLCRVLGAGMVRRGRGHIINISSSAAFVHASGTALYSASKAYVLSFTQGLALELAGSGVQVQAVCPGMVDTDFHTRMGVSRTEGFRKFLPFRSPDAVVADAMADLHRGKTVSIPDRGGRLLRQVERLWPGGVEKAMMRAPLGHMINDV